MKKTLWSGVLTLVLAAGAFGADVEKVLKAIHQKAETSLCFIECRVLVAGEETTHSGIGICIDPSGLMLTTAIRPQTKAEDIREITAYAPGLDAKPLKAKLQGLEAMSGLSFVRVEEKHNWGAVEFQNSAGVALGDLVVSAGLNGGTPDRPITLGMGYVSNEQRVPNRIIRVTGGALSMIGSVVFNAQGRAIGLITTQPYVPYQAYRGQRSAQTLLLRNLDQTVCFTPVEEFVQLLTNIPKEGAVRRPCWIGGFFMAVPETLREAKGLTGQAVMLDQVIPGSAAEKAGLKNRDIVVGIDGAPIQSLGKDELTASALRQKTARMKPGETLTLTIQGSGGTRDVKVPVEEMPLTAAEAPKLFQKELGFALREKVPFDAISGDPNADKPGLIAFAVVPRSPADDGDLRKDDLVTAIEGRPVSTAVAAESIIRQTLEGAQGGSIKVTVQRGDMSETLTIKAPEE
ncbi:MAG: PDZ domain-containing protein [Phycisphaerae bacterium]|nr:PDZ domain-containing protein [Phycisphaerae bacterium]